MAKQTKRMKAIKAQLQPGKYYPVDEAFDLLKSLPTAKFTESVDVSINLGIDPRKSDQMVRGSTILPHGTGKTARVAVFTQGDYVRVAEEAGADIVGLEELAQQVQKGLCDFDVVIASPDVMRVVGRLGKILGPRGLMPNPKVGTVTTDIATAVKNAKGGQVRYRTDKAGIIHSSVGKISFTTEALRDNLKTLIVDLQKLKPSVAKGIYLKKVTVSTTMGPGIALEMASL